MTSYPTTDPKLWRREPHGTYYALWQQDGKTCKKALIPPGYTRATKDKIVAKRLLANFKRDLYSEKIKITHKGEMPRKPLAEACREFLEEVTIGKRPKTRELYQSYMDFLLEIFGDITCNQIDSTILYKFQLACFKKGLQPNTINNRVRTVKTFLKWATRNKYVSGIDLDDTPKKLPVEEVHRHLTRDEIKKIFSNLTNLQIYDFFLCDCHGGATCRGNLEIVL